MKPKDFQGLTSGQLKKKYRDLSRKYHPDKNRQNGNDTTEIFMEIKTAFEILGDPEKRVSYDIYGQVDFSGDDKMRNMIEQKFKNQTERQAQFNAYKMGQKNMKVFGEVAPYYATWLLLTIYRVDVSTFQRLCF